jgi:hypothetical protein
VQIGKIGLQTHKKKVWKEARNHQKRLQTLQNLLQIEKSKDAIRSSRHTKTQAKSILEYAQATRYQPD